MKKISQFIIICLLLPAVSLGQTFISGKVISITDNSPLAGASVRIKGTTVGIQTLEDGYFSLKAPTPMTLEVSYTGFVTQEIAVRTPPDHQLTIKLQRTENQLQEVIVSTGYQELPKERATGSFVQVDRNLINRSVSTDILTRLADVVPGLTFNKIGTRTGEQTAISIRGQSTIFARTSPLIVVDNFPYEGDITNINPNDVESITILKDAAAASIWGTRAGNGVIVITTKKGKYNQATKVSVNSNVTMTAKPDAFYAPVMTTGDFIDMERTLFAKGFYNSLENSTSKPALTPVVELLIAARKGQISSQDAERAINALRGNDVRNDISKYLYQQAVNQQYNVNISGGSAQQKFYLSAGYDHNQDNQAGNGYQRLTIDAHHTYRFWEGRLTIGTGIFTAFSQTPQNALPYSSLNYGIAKPIYPYATFAGATGNALAVNHAYNQSLLQTAQSQGLLDWTFLPLNELAAADQRSSVNDQRYTIDAKYRLFSGLQVSGNYQFNKTYNAYRNLQSTATWYTRDQINRLTTVNTDGSLNLPVPVGGILDLRNSHTDNHTVRAQLDYDKLLGGNHQLNVIAGAERRDIHSSGNSVRYYGYDDEHAASQPVDYTSAFGSYLFPLTKSNKIQNVDGLSDLTDRFVSYYTNAGYTFKGRYTASASARLDQSNLFGVATNQKGVPLYSTGLSWKLSAEPFFKISWLPSLTLRATYGSNGNIDNTLSAFTTATYFSASNSFLGLPYATILNPPNPQLRWERVKIANFGLDFSTREERLSGTLEYYIKNGTDLIGNAPLAPQTGLNQFRGNTAGIKGSGIDLTLNSRNLTGKFHWNTTLLFSWSSDKVSRYELPSNNAARDFLNGSYSIVPAVGKSLYGIYSYRWAGLEPSTGDPQGYLNGTVSKDYSAIIAAATFDNITYHGSARPTVYGALRNTFSYKQISLSANISYRLNYFVRRASVQYSTVLSGLGGHGDYSKRWQKPGDERSTQIPSTPTAINTNRDNFYANSAVLVQKGDNVRLQDITVNYDLNKKDIPGLPFNALHLYVYASNLGILWKAANNRLDPDAVNNNQMPLPRSIALGLKADF
jgi:TonB-linked SusC/RagA family outer membrane protein